MLSDLDEVIVIGYGSTSSKKMVAAVTAVKGVDYRKHGQFEWTGPAILFVCLIFVLLAPNYIWGIVGL